jgi:hypothetical protein
MFAINRKAHFAVVGITVAMVGTAAFALPGPTACALVGFAGLNSIGQGLLTDSESEAERRRYIELVRDARARIEATFGTPESNPILVMLDQSSGLGPFRLNSYGSTQMVGSRACVMVGPKGQNVDVVAHELMHAELHHRVGFVQRFLQVPTWFDEGVAMQVDYRSDYLLSAQEAANSDYVRLLTTGSAFFAVEREALTRNYASAKAVVASWTARTGAATLYQRLSRIKSGESFAEVVPERELTIRSSGLPPAAVELKR